jgi:hypothetical protein
VTKAAGRVYKKPEFEERKDLSTAPKTNIGHMWRGNEKKNPRNQAKTHTSLEG